MFARAIRLQPSIVGVAIRISANVLTINALAAIATAATAPSAFHAGADALICTAYTQNTPTYGGFSARGPRRRQLNGRWVV